MYCAWALSTEDIYLLIDLVMTLAHEKLTWELGTSKGIIRRVIKPLQKIAMHLLFPRGLQEAIYISYLFDITEILS